MFEGQDCPLGFGVVMLLSAMPGALGSIPCALSTFPSAGWALGCGASPRCCSPVERGQGRARGLPGVRGQTQQSLGVGRVPQSSRGCCQPVSNN